jgi:uncharacterized protein Yka (UPF0111/DUF47 family)
VDGGEAMNLCDDGHEEVCYEGRSCPVCEKMDEIRELENEIDRLTRDIEEMEGE